MTVLETKHMNQQLLSWLQKTKSETYMKLLDFISTQSCKWLHMKSR